MSPRYPPPRARHACSFYVKHLRNGLEDFEEWTKELQNDSERAPGPL